MKINLPQKSTIVKSEGNRAILEIEGLYPGYGVTLGNALRRVLLSSLPGAAIVGVKIKGVNHEFSTLPHVAEDTVEIILNLRQIRFKKFTDEPVKIFLNIKGEREVRAKDIKITSEIEIINPEALIATLTDKKAELEMEIEVASGLGFAPVESRKKEKLEIGVIAVDSLFSPIRKVNFEVENMRVGDRTDYNRLRLDLETDGSISAEAAFLAACRILAEQFGILGGAEQHEIGKESSTEEKRLTVSQENGDKDDNEEAAKIKVEDMKLSTRTVNALIDGGIRTAGGLAKKNAKSLSEIDGMGEKSVGEVRKALKKIGLNLKED